MSYQPPGRRKRSAGIAATALIAGSIALGVGEISAPAPAMLNVDVGADGTVLRVVG